MNPCECNRDIRAGELIVAVFSGHPPAALALARALESDIQWLCSPVDDQMGWGVKRRLR